MGFKYSTLLEIIELLKEWNVPGNSVPEKLINRGIAEITDEGHPLAIKWYLKGLIATGLIQQVGPGTYDIIYEPRKLESRLGEEEGKDAKK
jgi:hypothetical protein